jgi:hypothetical protein
MSILYTTLLIIAAIAFGIYGTREFIAYSKRKANKARFRDYSQVLVGVNPKKGRRTIYETADSRTQRLHWLVAQNRGSIAEGLKEFAAAQSVDNSSIHMDTFGVRHSSVIHRQLVRKVLKRSRMMYFNIKDNMRGLLMRTNSKAIQTLKVVSRVIIRPIRALRNLIKTTFGSGGNNNEDNSIR